MGRVLLMNEPRLFRALSSEIRNVFGQWLTAEYTAGARFLVLEGLMNSGKSMLTKQPFVLGARQSVNIELDNFLRQPVDPDTEYMDAFDIDAATAAVMEAYRTTPLVIAEGPIGWPVVQCILQEIPRREVRRVYLKRMSPRNPDEWEDFEFLEEYERPTAYGRSIDRYHATERPWLLADVVFERIGRDEE
jgi:hypothetical protein